MTVFIRSIDGQLIRFDTVGRLLVSQERTTLEEGGRGEPLPMVRATTPPFGASHIGRPAKGTDGQQLLAEFAMRLGYAESGIWGIRDGVIYCENPLDPCPSRTFPLLEATAPEEKK